MIRNLFSVFDPTTSIIGWSLNWLAVFAGFFLIPVSFWLFPSRRRILWWRILEGLHKEFKVLIGPRSALGGTLIFVSLFGLILFNNRLGLFPYVFTATSHLVMTLALALPLWLSFMLFGWINHTQHIFAHLVPEGTPAVLIPFIVCIETIRNIIRPGTLAVRLTANIIAGHLLLTLLGNTGAGLRTRLVGVLVRVQIALLMLESAVAGIQSYVFAVLRALYSKEVV